MTNLLAPVGRQRTFTDLGVVAPGALLHTYVSGTPSTPLATTSDAAGLVPNANPIVASAGGLFGPIYLTPGTAYHFVLTDAAGLAIWDQDPVTVGGGGAGTIVAGPGIIVSVDGAGVITIGVAAASASVVNDFRLTLESGVPISSTDQLAKTTVYATPVGRGNRIDLFDATGLPTRLTSAQVSIALPAVASQVYDVFGYNVSGVFTLELLAWTNDTTRATALTLATTGTYTKTGDLTRRYLGTIRTTSVAGQTEDSTLKRYLWNYYHRVPRVLQRFETTASWPYTTATVRQANGAAANQVEIVIGLADVPIDLSLATAASNSTGPTLISAGIGEDSLTTYTAGVHTNTTTGTAVPLPLICRLVKMPAIGRHVYSWNEYSQASGTTTFYGAVASAGSTITNGLTGRIEG